MRKLTLIALSFTLMLGACARNMSSSTYTEGAATGLVLEGVVISARPVTIKASDKLGQGNGAGILAGGAAGGLAGSTVGNGKGQAAAAIGGAIAGAVLGALVQDELSKSDGMEYIVKVGKDNIGNYKSKNNKKVTINHTKKNGMEIDTNLKSEMVAVVQGKDVIYKAGQHVYVIYSDDRPRIVAKEAN